MRLYLSNLSPTTTAQHLQELFDQFGSSLVLELQRVRRAGYVAGTAVVRMSTIEALTAVRTLNGQTFRGRRLYITAVAEEALKLAPANVNSHLRLRLESAKSD